MLVLTAAVLYSFSAEEKSAIHGGRPVEMPAHVQVLALCLASGIAAAISTRNNKEQP
jgi:hypothetical protein